MFNFIKSTKYKMKNKKNIVFLVLVALFQVLSGQEITSHLDKYSGYNKALELFREQKYNPAQQEFQLIIDSKHLYPQYIVEDATYRDVLCAIELLNPDAPYKTESFVSLFPASGKLNQLYFETGRYYYRQKEFTNALDWFEKVQTGKLFSKDKDEYYFSSGYCYFVNDSTDKARLKFFEIKEGNSAYAASAQYYYSHINYQQGNYQTALEGFMKLGNDSTFAPIVPYYICYIYFLQEKYKDVIDYASDFLDNVTEKRKAEVARIIAESYFYLKKYNEAIPFYVIYAENATNLTEEDYYQSGYSLYKAENYKKAASQFEKISNSNTILGQNASYHLADCYIKMGDKQKAIIAFTNASETNYDPKIKEDAMFNAAVLNYELSISPFSEAIRFLEEYIETYPDSKRLEEAYNYLVLAYMNTKNYDFAYNSIKKISKPNDQVKQAYQHIAFFRAIELIENKQYNDALEKLNTSLKYSNYDSRIAALSKYWKAECLYRTKHYNDAVNQYNEFILSPGAFSMIEYKTAHYNLGYCCFKQQKFNEALSWFRKYIDFKDKKQPGLLADAYIRAGDIFYLQSNYTSAIDFYSDAIKLKGISTDYALYQKGFTYGLMAKYNLKISTLEELIRNFPSSSYIDDAIFETAISHQAVNNLQTAELYYKKLVSEYPGSKNVKRSLVQLGLIYYNKNEFDKAISSYKRVIAYYPGTGEANSALKGLKNIYIEQNKVETYIDYVDEIGGQAKVTGTEKDSLLFTNAESIYFKGNCDNSVSKLNEYLSQASNPVFIKRATIYLADCYTKQRRNNEALDAYNKVISMPGTDFKEQALLEASRINYTNGSYEQALNNYNELEKVAQTDDNLLEALIGKLRCYNKTGNYNKTVESASQVLKSEKLNDAFRKEANYIQSMGYYHLKEYSEALEGFKLLSSNVKTKEGAESKYHIAEIYFIRSNYDKAEETIYDFIKTNTPHQYWLAKSYLLLAEIFIKKDDTFQAAHTVKSILDYYDNKTDGIIDEAQNIKKKIGEIDSAAKSGSNELEISIENN